MTTLFITGVTGFLGGAALEKILHQETRLDLLLLVRADSPEAGLERVKENMRKFNIAEEKLAMLRQQHILLGDLASRSIFLTIRASIRSRTSSTAPLSLHLAATRLSGRLTLRARCARRNVWRK